MSQNSERHYTTHHYVERSFFLIITLMISFLPNYLGGDIPEHLLAEQYCGNTAPLSNTAS